MKKAAFTLFDKLFVPGDTMLRFLGAHYELFRWFLSWTPSWTLRYSSSLRALRAYHHAQLTVPAYASFLTERSAKLTTDFSQIPATDKENYIKQFSTASRCVGGRIPLANTVIDESSGSSGTPYNWVRSLEERLTSHGFVSYFARYCFDLPNLITLNAFSMGSWATGLNMGLSMQQNGMVKNIGPDVDKILSTLGFFGKEYNYLLTGYPPFLKHLIDEAGRRGFPLSEYRLYGLVGGEGMSEGLRRYLETVFVKVYSGYGATDLEIGIAGETPVTTLIRQEVERNPALRGALFGDDTRLPMVFHYNPLMHYVETNEIGELIFTVTRLNLLSPRVRYNIHDEGGVRDFKNMVRICKENGLDIRKHFGPDYSRMPKLPFLWVFGRKDSTVSVMGANIYPEDLESALYADRELAQCVRSFCMSLAEDEHGGVRPRFEFEVIDKEITDVLKTEYQESILKHLIGLNKDFAEAYHEHPDSLVPIINLWNEGQGPFARNSGRIKQVRIVS